MVVLTPEKRFDSALYGLPQSIARVLSLLSTDIKASVQEIRLRSEKPLALTINNKCVFVSRDSKIKEEQDASLLIVKSAQVQESFKLLIRGSVYSHLSEIKEGYIMMRHGHRAGICGSFTKSGNMSNVSSVNIRISKEVFGAADSIIKAYNGKGVLIAGPPGSGKTTVLRDFVRQLSSGINTTAKRVCVVDTRGEISASYLGECFNDLGQNTDVLIGYGKKQGFLMAIRTMFPQMVAFDEFGTKEELDGIAEGFLSGVEVALTAHINCEEDLMKRDITRSLLLSGVIGTVVILSGYPFEKITVKSVEEVIR